MKWPYGWTGWRSGDKVLLLSPAGIVIARTGDRVTWGGANTTNDGIPYACTSIGIVEDR